jgi:hypothetical protein
MERPARSTALRACDGAPRAIQRNARKASNSMSTAKGAGPSAGRTAYLVLGMHRSGTSAVTQLLALAGAHLPRNVMPGDEHNAKGYFEPWKIAMLNDRRLRAGGGAWDDPFAFPHRALPAAEERVWIDRAVALFTQEYGTAAYPLLKDPRTSVLLPFWRAVLGELEVAARCVIAVRHPLAVAASLGRRDGFAVEKSLLVWTSYMLAAEEYSRDLPRAFVDYDALVADWRAEAARIEAAHDAPLPALTAKAAKSVDKFLTAELRHNAAETDLKAYGWAGELAETALGWFMAAAQDKSRTVRPLGAVRDELARRNAEIGVLVSPAARDLDAARSELLELRQLRDFMTAELAYLRRERTAIETALAPLLAEA